MPIYEYACEDCGHTLEKIQKMSDAPLVECPECGHAALKKLVSAGGFILPGSGWHKPSPAAESGGGDAAPSCASGGCCACAD